MKKYLIVTVLLLICVPTIQASIMIQADSTERFEALISKTAKVIGTDSAIYYLDQASKMVRNTRELMKLNRISAAPFLYKKQTDSAHFLLRKNIELNRDLNDSSVQTELAFTYFTYMYVYDQQDTLELKIESLKKAAGIFESWSPSNYSLGEVYDHLAKEYTLLEDYDEALFWNKKKLKYGLKYQHKLHQVGAYYQLGLVEQRRLRVTSAKEYYLHALNAMEPESDEFFTSYVLIYNALGGNFLAQENYDSASVYFNLGLELLKFNNKGLITDSREKYFWGIFTKNLATTHYQQGEFGKAINEYREVLSSYEKQYPDGNNEMVRILADLGKVYLKDRQIELAENRLIQALKIAKKRNYDIAKCHQDMGFFFRSTKQWQPALAHYDSALSRIQDSERIAKAGRRPTQELASLGEIIQIYCSMDSTDPIELDSLFDQYMDLVNFVYSYSDSKLSITSIQAAMAKMYRYYLSLYVNSKNDKWLDRLWQIMETTKAIKLKNQLRTEYSLSYGLPDSTLLAGKELRKSISTLESKLAPGIYDSSLFILKNQYRHYLDEIETDYPQYYALKNDFTIKKFREIQSELKSDELLLSFLQGQDTTQLLSIRRNGIGYRSFSTQELDKSIYQMNQALLKSDENGLKIASSTIVKLLDLDPNDLSDVSTIQIIPDGNVWNLNFAALVGTQGNDKGFLGNEVNLSFKYFSNEEIYRKSSPKAEVLAFSFNSKSDANVVSESLNFRDLNSSIPGTSTEIASISSLLKGDYFFSKKANETSFKERSTTYGILHLAVHGYENKLNPEHSYLKFASADSLNDGKLHVYEIYNLNLNADLAVLSACHSGQGKIVAGEGMMSLGRAFAYAGVRSLLISRWEVSDYSAPHLMKYFYQGLKEGMYKSEALKFAQTEYLKNHSDGLTSSPFYWSSFYVLGDDSPIFEEATFNPWIIGLILLLLSSGTLVYVRARTRKT